MAILFALLVSLPLIDLGGWCIPLVASFIDPTAADVGSSAHDCNSAARNVKVWSFRLQERLMSRTVWAWWGKGTVR